MRPDDCLFRTGLRQAQPSFGGGLELATEDAFGKEAAEESKHAVSTVERHLSKGQESYRSDSFGSYCSFSEATTFGSASVVVSPRARPSAISRRSRRMILPDRVFGRSAENSTSSGFAIAPIFSPTNSRSSAASCELCL